MPSNKILQLLPVDSSNTSAQMIVGISLLDDILLSQGEKSIEYQCGTTVGFVILLSAEINVRDLRRIIAEQLPSVLPSYSFLTKHGWPVKDTQEESLKVNQLINSSIITIKRHFELPRIGIRTIQGDILGFIFSSLSTSLPDVHQTIMQQLANSFSQIKSFEFIDKNGWPVNEHQEEKLVGWDIYKNGNFVINTQSQFSHDASHYIRNYDSTDGIKRRHKRNSSVGEGSKIVPVKKLSVEFIPKPVVISYVHNEANNYARALKRELVKLGMDVFLDVDEIHGGLDWQDILNSAISSCRIFIPIVTTHYGETQWTNREIKLADSKSKQIIPISFINEWPPDSLAIQFCSLHYISSRYRDETKISYENEPNNVTNDIDFWEHSSVLRVAQEIYSYFINSDSAQDNSDIKNYPEPSSLYIEPSSPVVKEKFNIVISLHHKQKDFAYKMSKALTDEGYDVWCSTDMLDPSEDNWSTSDSLSIPSTPVTSAPEQNYDSQNIGESFNLDANPYKFFRQPSYSTDCGVGFASQNWSQGVLTPTSESNNKLKIFQKKIKTAKLVIILVSSDYCCSRTCKQQAFYCELRVKVLAVKYKTCNIPCMITKLLPEEMLEADDSSEFIDKLISKVKWYIDQPCLDCSKALSPNKDKLLPMVCELQKQISDEVCIYILGGTKFHHSRSEDICRALGQELASLDFVSLATGGFFGVSEVVGRSFCEERDMMREKPARLYHILPHHDPEDLSEKAHQKEDRTFYKVPYGQSLFFGNSIKERNSIVARAFRFCILIEGGPRAAEEAEEFVWNDHVVIPIPSTGRAAAGEYGITKRILEIPCGVSEDHWRSLAQPNIRPEIIARNVKFTIQSLRQCRLQRENSIKAKNAKNKPPIKNFSRKPSRKF